MVLLGEGISKRNKKSKRSKVIHFDNEIITRENAEKLIEEKNRGVQEKEIHENKTSVRGQELQEKQKSKKQLKKQKKQANQIDQTKRKHISESEKGESPKQSVKETLLEKPEDSEEPTTSITEDNETVKPTKKKKRKQLVDDTVLETQEELNIEKPEVKKKDSIRQKKKQKHAKLIEEKKLKVELGLQQKSINYLSKWKHSRSDWKFEKLRQIWLQQNMFDTSKFPNEFWDTLVEYFNGSKGQTRKDVLADALKIVDEENLKEGNEDEDYQQKLKRARDIVQSLQE